MTQDIHPIGIFDSGYGGLTILKEIVRKLPDYDFYYLGDNARTPYGTRSYDIVYQYTREAVIKLFDMGCHLVILACNTASAKALRTLQQNDIPRIDPNRRVLGVIRPSVEKIPELTRTRHVGILATTGTVLSDSYPMEIRKISGGNDIITHQEACPMWVPIVENNEIDTPGAAYFIRKDITRLIDKDPLIDTLVLACTHYPLLLKQIIKIVPGHIRIISQGKIVAASLVDYLKRHPEMDAVCTKNGTLNFFTTESIRTFEEKAEFFLNHGLRVHHIHLTETPIHNLICSR